MLHFVFLLFLSKLQTEEDIFYEDIYWTINLEAKTATFLNSFLEDVRIPSFFVYKDVRYNVTTIKPKETIYLTTIIIPTSVQTIENFDYIHFLKEIRLNEGFKVIKSRWFQNVESSQIYCYLPDSLTTIESYAFFNSSIYDVIYGPNLESIGERAFAKSKLYRIKPREYSNLKTIGDFAFNNCYDLEIIETMLANLTTLKQYAFNATKSLNVNITLPDTILQISEGLFSYSGIIGINFGSNITYIGKYAFYSCPSLNCSVKYPETLKQIDDYAFANTPIASCLPFLYNNVNTFGTGVFMYCSRLNNIMSLLTSTPVISFYMFAFTQNIEESVMLPANINKVAGHAFFNCSSIKSIRYPEYFKTIGDYAFASSSLEEIISFTDNHVDSIGIGAFMNCTNFKCFGSILEHAPYIRDYAFANCVSLTDFLAVGDGKQEIWQYAFANTSITMIYLKDLTTKIGKGAFQGCSKITQVTGLGLLTEIAEDAFMGCSSLVRFDFTDKIAKINNRAFYHTKLTNITIPNLQSLSPTAFIIENEIEIFNVSVPIIEFNENMMLKIKKLILKAESVTFAKSYFENSNIKSVHLTTNQIDIPEKLFYKSLIENFTIVKISENYSAKANIGKNAFCDTPLNHFSATINRAEEGAFEGTLIETTPVIFDYIGEHCFERAPLVDVIINSQYTEMTAFKNCHNIKTIKFGKNAKTLFNVSFSDSLVEKVEFDPDCQITEIPDGMFQNQKRLTQMSDLPSGLLYIGSAAFTNASIPCPDFSKCSKLKAISDLAFCSAITDGPLKLPSTLEYIGSLAFAFTNIKGEIVFPATLKKIGLGAFKNCLGIDKIDLANADSLTSIESYAFYYCTKITNELVLPKNIKAIGAFSFYNCPKMTGITLPESVTEIAEGAFYYCLAFSGVLKIPQSVRVIGEKAFYGIRNITRIDFASKDIEIRDNAFTGMSFKCMTNLPKNCSNTGNGSRCYESDSFGIWGKLCEDCNKLYKTKYYILPISIGASLLVILVVIIALVCFFKKRNSKGAVKMNQSLLSML